MTQQRPHLRRAAIFAMAALLGVLAAAALTRGDGPPADAGLDRSTVLPADITEPARRPEVGAAAAGTTEEAGRRLSPTGLTIPRIELRLPVRARGVDRSGAMALPRTPWAVSWYRFGPAPRSAAGATVLAGHVDTAEHGVGPLARLGELRAGDRLRVTTGRRVVQYAVTSVTRIGKSVLNLPAIFSRTGPPRLHLVTCGGEYLPERGGYQDNVVVAARRV